MYYRAFTVWVSQGQAEVTGTRELANKNFYHMNYFVYQGSVEDLKHSGLFSKNILLSGTVTESQTYREIQGKKKHILSQESEVWDIF